MPQLASELTAEAISARLREGLGDALIEVIEAHGQITARVKADSWVEAAAFIKNDEVLGCTFFSWLSAIDWTEQVRADATLDAEADENDGADDQGAADADADRPDADEVGAKTDATAETDAKTDEGGAAEAPFEPFPASHEAGTYAQPVGELFQIVALAEAPTKGYGVILKTELPRNEASIASLTGVFAGANWHERECNEMFGIDFDGHPGLGPLYLPEEFEGHPLLKTFLLGAREIKPWPGLVDVEEIPAALEPILDATARGGVLAPEAPEAAETASDAVAAGSAEGGDS